MTARSPRLAARTAGSFLLSAALLTLTACVTRTGLEDGEEPAEDLSLGVNLLLFLGIPLLIMILTAVPIWVAASRRRSRYRPSEGWDHQPLWFAGPDDPEAAVSAAAPEQPGRGGASASW